MVSDIYGRIIDSTKTLIDSDGDFLDKLNGIVGSKIQSLSVMKGDFLNELFSTTNNPVAAKFQEDLKALMYAFFDQGKEQGYISKDIDNQVLYNYSELFNAGFQKLYTSGRIDASDKVTLDQMIDLYFYGLIDKKRELKAPSNVYSTYEDAFLIKIRYQEYSVVALQLLCIFHSSVWSQDKS